MSLMDKVKFWKSDDDLDLDSELPPLDEDMGKSFSNPMPQDNLGLDTPDMGPDRSSRDFASPHMPDQSFPQQQSFSSPSFQQQASQPSGDIQRDLQLISSKLDTIKAELDSVNQRLMSLERNSQSREEGGKKFYSKDPWGNY